MRGRPVRGSPLPPNLGCVPLHGDGRPGVLANPSSKGPGAHGWRRERDLEIGGGATRWAVALGTRALVMEGLSLMAVASALYSVLPSPKPAWLGWGSPSTRTEVQTYVCPTALAEPLSV